MTFRFESIGNSEKVGYIFKKDWNSANYKGLSEHLFQFLTYDDGGIQHSPEGPVQEINVIDCLWSLASHLLSNPQDVEGTEYRWFRPMAPEFLQFIASVKHKEGKTRYCSLSEMKVSGVESKRHDKRYEEVLSWQDGSFDSMIRLARDEFDSVLTMIGKASQVREFLYHQDGSWPFVSGFEAFDWHKLESAWSCVDSLVVAWRKTEMAKRHLESHLSQMDWERKQALKLAETPEIEVEAIA